MNMAAATSSPAICLQKLLNSHSVFLVPTDLTHHKFHCGSHAWLDLFIVKSAESIVAYHKSPAPFIPGHDFIYISLSCKKHAPVAKSILTCSLKKVSPVALHHSLTRHISLLQSHTPFPPNTSIATIPTPEIVLGPCPINIDHVERALTTSITATFNETAPLRRVILSTRRKPWVSPQIRALMKARDRAYRTARTSGCVHDFARFCLLRAEASNALDTAKYNHIATRLSDAPSAETKWRELRNLRITAPTLPSPFLTFDVATLRGSAKSSSNCQ